MAIDDDQTPEDFILSLARSPGFLGIVRPQADVIAARFDIAGRTTRIASKRARDEDDPDEEHEVFQLIVEAKDCFGEFRLIHDLTTVENHARSVDAAWTDEEMRIFFARRVYVSSRRTRAEAAAFLALPLSTQEELIRLAERFDCHISITGEDLLVELHELGQFRFYARKEGASDLAVHLLGIAEGLARLLDTFPQGRIAPPPPPTLVRCSFCAAYFFPRKTPVVCVHCGAPGTDGKTTREAG